MTEEIRRRIAADLVNGPRWSQSYRRVKMVVDQMVVDGEIGRCAPPNNHNKSMIGLTQHGADRYLPGVDVETVPPSGPTYYRDMIAEGVANGKTRATICAELGISAHYGYLLWNEIKLGLGWQAQ